MIFYIDRAAAGVACLVQYREELIAASELAEFGAFDWLSWMWSTRPAVTQWGRDLTLDYGM